MAKTGSKPTRGQHNGRITGSNEKTLALVEKAKSGSETQKRLAFNDLFESYKVMLMSYVTNAFNDLTSYEIEDIVMVSFQKAFLQIDSFDGMHSFTTWLQTIARNTARDTHDREVVRGKGRIEPLGDDPEEKLGGLGGMDDGPESIYINTENYDTLVETIDNLPDLYSDIARMNIIEGMEYNQIAEQLGININTVKTRIRRAKSMLEERMKQDS